MNTVKFPPPPTPEYPPFEEAVREVQEAAQQDKSITRCLNCKQPGFYYPADKSYVEGHCYSELGRVEYTSLSRICEWCFDKLAAALSEEDPEYTPEPGSFEDEQLFLDPDPRTFDPGDFNL